MRLQNRLCRLGITALSLLPANAAAQQQPPADLSVLRKVAPLLSAKHRDAAFRFTKNGETLAMLETLHDARGRKRVAADDIRWAHLTLYSKNKQMALLLGVSFILGPDNPWFEKNESRKLPVQDSTCENQGWRIEKVSSMTPEEKNQFSQILNRCLTHEQIKVVPVAIPKCRY